MLLMLGSKYFLPQHHYIELTRDYVLPYVIVYCQLEILLRVSLNVKLTTFGQTYGSSFCGKIEIPTYVKMIF